MNSINSNDDFTVSRDPGNAILQSQPFQSYKQTGFNTNMALQSFHLATDDTDDVTKVSMKNFNQKIILF